MMTRGLRTLSRQRNRWRSWRRNRKLLGQGIEVGQMPAHTVEDEVENMDKEVDRSDDLWNACASIQKTGRDAKKFDARKSRTIR